MEALAYQGFILAAALPRSKGRCVAVLHLSFSFQLDDVTAPEVDVGGLVSARWCDRQH